MSEDVKRPYSRVISSRAIFLTCFLQLNENIKYQFPQFLNLFNSRATQTGSNYSLFTGVCGSADSFNLHINAEKQFERQRRVFFGLSNEKTRKKSGQESDWKALGKMVWVYFFCNNFKLSIGHCNKILFQWWICTVFYFA